MTDYVAQAQAFLDTTGSTLEITFLDCKPMGWDSDNGQARDVYQCQLQRGTRSVTFEYGNSSHHSGKFHLFGDYQQGISTFGKCWIRQGLETKQIAGSRITPPGVRNWKVNPNYAVPSMYSVLTCLHVDECSNIDDFAKDMGITQPSVAIRMFHKIRRQNASLQALFNEAELEQLYEIYWTPRG